MVNQYSLRDGSTLLYDESFFIPAEADALFAELRAATPWKQEISRGRPFPRLTAWYAAGVNTPVLVPNSINGNQITALQELFTAFSA